jgi:hypothetical protein
MTDTYTTTNRLIKQTLASNRGQWGDPNINTLVDSVDQSLDGYLEVDCSGGSNITLTSTDAAVDQSRNRMLRFTGTMTASISVTIPDTTKWYILWDATTRAGYTLTFKNASGTGVEPTNGQREIVLNDGTDIRKVEAGNTLSSIGAPTDNVSFAGFRATNLGAPTATSDAATKAYVDAQISGASILPLTADWGNVASGVQVQHRRDTRANINAFTPAQGELVMNTTDGELRLGDGSTAGGVPIATRTAAIAYAIVLGG